MFKTVSSDCNLDCGYCYYRQSLEGERLQRRIDLSLLERFFPVYMDYIADAHQANLSWQGGEPTLAGLDFFRGVAELEAKYAHPPTVISNAVQTNAVLLDDRWAEFFAAYRFLVGVSLDGPQEIHDMVRKDRGGHGSFRRVMASIDALRKHKVDLNILCVVGPHNVRQAGDLMRFFRNEGLNYLQFIPAMNFQSTEPDKTAAYLVNPEEYGRLLVELFDGWYGNGIPVASIRIFDNLLQSFLGLNNDLCVHGESCDSGIVVEANGDVFPCDFYIHREWQSGNIYRDSLKGMVEGEKRRQFIGRKQPLPPACQACEWLKLCKGECPRNRLSVAVSAPTYFCESYKTLFAHASGRIQLLGERLRNYRRYLDWQSANSGRIPGRNEFCPCGSSRKYKSCCGDPALSSSYLFRVE